MIDAGSVLQQPALRPLINGERQLDFQHCLSHYCAVVVVVAVVVGAVAVGAVALVVVGAVAAYFIKFCAKSIYSQAVRKQCQSLLLSL